MARLPPPRAIIALEAVVRTGSVSAAADELCVTHSAVSKQVTQLEVWLGRPLFSANRRHMVPTAEARRLSEAAGMAWALIAAAVDEISRRQQQPDLKVVAPATFAMRWLLPKLPDLAGELSSAKILVRQTHTQDDWRDIPFYVILRRGGSCPTHLEPTTLFTEELTLVAVPSLKEEVSGNHGNLHQIDFVEAETRPGELISWLRSAGITPAKDPLIFPHFHIALEAALAGRGALLTPTIVVEDLLQRGDLCELDSDRRLTGPAYWAGVNPVGPNVSTARAFVTWMEKTLRKRTNTELGDESLFDELAIQPLKESRAFSR